MYKHEGFKERETEQDITTTTEYLCWDLSLIPIWVNSLDLKIFEEKILPSL